MSKKKHQVMASMDKDAMETGLEAQQMQDQMAIQAQSQMNEEARDSQMRQKQAANDDNLRSQKADLALQNFQKDLERNKKSD